MTPEEAIRIIKIVLAIAEDFEITVQGEEFTEEKCKEAVEIVTKVLEQQPCEDCISREAVLDEIDKYIKKAQSTGIKDDFISFEELVVKQLPSVTPKAETEAYNKGYTDAMRDIGDTQ